MSNENNKFQIDIENLFKQNVNDLSSIKELYRRIEELGERISQIKYIDSTLANKLKKEYDKLKKIIMDENVQVYLANEIEKINENLINEIELINLQIDNKIDEFNLKLTNNIESINSQLDTKAKQSDLKTLESRMNSFTALSEGSTTGDAELIDGRIGIDGTIHDNIGNAIRSQFNEVFDIDITEGYVIENGELLTGQYAMADTTIHLNESTDRVAKKFTINGGLKYKAVGFYQASEWTSLYIITDEQGKILANYYSDDNNSWHTEPVEFVAPSNAKYIYVNGSTQANTNAYVEPQLFVYTKVVDNVVPKWEEPIKTIEESVDVFKVTIDNFAEKLFDKKTEFGYVIQNGELLTGQYAMADTTVHLNESIDRVAKKFEIKGNTKYKAVGFYQASEWTSLYIITDEQGKILVNYYSDDNNSWHTEPVEFVTPSNAKYIYVNGSTQDNTIAYVEPQLFVYKLEEELVPRWEDYINGIRVDVNEIQKYISKESFIDKKIKDMVSFAKITTKFSNVETVPSNMKRVTESLYGNNGIIATSLIDDKYKVTLDISCNFEVDKKYFLTFKTDRNELMITKALNISLYDTNNIVVWTNGTDYNFSYPLTNGWNMYELKNIPTCSVSKIDISISNITDDNIPNIIWDSIICDRKIKPFVFYCTDNGFSNCYDKIAPILKANNMKGCTSISNTTDMTIEQIESLVKNGWDFAIYGMHNFDTIADWDSFVKNEDNFETLKNGIKASIDGFEDKKIPFPSAYFCRHNLSTPMLLKAVKSNKIDMVRTSAGTGLFQNYTIEDMEIPTIGLIDTNLTEVKSKIDYAVKNGFGICVFTHQVVDGGDTSLLNTGTEVFTEFCNYCKAYIDKGELVSYNARDVINNFTNSDIDTVKIREMEYKLSKL